MQTYLTSQQTGLIPWNVWSMLLHMRQVSTLPQLAVWRSLSILSWERRLNTPDRIRDIDSLWNRSATTRRLEPRGLSRPSGITM